MAGYRRPASGRGGLLLLAALSVAAVAAALVSQHVFDMRPCPWCILQRLIFLVIAAVALAGALIPAAAARLCAAGLAGALAASGIAAAMYQHFVAAKSDSCNLTLADRIVNSLGLGEALPSVFQVTAMCSEAAAMLRVPYAFWSAAAFALLLALALRVASRATR